MAKDTSTIELSGATYNSGSGKLYKDGMPMFSKVFEDEVEAEAYLLGLGRVNRIKECL